jgi:hypothetical protein
MSWGPSDEREYREGLEADRRRAKAHRDWWATGDTGAQEIRCENCDEITDADNWIAGLGAVICPVCLETLMDSPEERL